MRVRTALRLAKDWRKLKLPQPTLSPSRAHPNTRTHTPSALPVEQMLTLLFMFFSRFLQKNICIAIMVVHKLTTATFPAIQSSEHLMTGFNSFVHVLLPIYHCIPFQIHTMNFTEVKNVLHLTNKLTSSFFVIISCYIA